MQVVAPRMFVSVMTLAIARAHCLRATTLNAECFQEVNVMTTQDGHLTNHEVTICLAGGTLLFLLVEELA